MSVTDEPVWFLGADRVRRVHACRLRPLGWRRDQGSPA